MRYAQVDVIVEGALDESETIFTDEALESFIQGIERVANEDHQHTEVYVLWHEHSPYIDECGCAQYVTDHHPQYEFNKEVNA